MPDPLPHHRLAKIRTTSAILPRPAANERSEIEPSKKRVLCTPPFLDRAFQLRCRSLKACVSDLSDLSDLSDTRSGNRWGVLFSGGQMGQMGHLGPVGRG